jgi:hypothetical protein
VARFDAVLLRSPCDAWETHEKFLSQGICFQAKMHIDILPKCLVLFVLEVVVVTLVMFVPRTKLIVISFDVRLSR